MGDNYERLFTPENLIRNEQITIELPSEVNTAPADIFVFRKEITGNHWTQLGGTPYVERGFEWPKVDGKLLKFWGNFYFGDSLDLLGRKLPSDVLNIFIVEGQVDRPEFSIAIWSKSTTGRRLEPEFVPDEVRNHFQFQGVRHRTKLVVSKPALVLGKTEKWRDLADKVIVNEVIAITNKHPFLENGFTPYPFKKRDHTKLVAVASWFKWTGKWPLIDSETPIDFQHETDEGFFLIFVDDDGTTDIGYGHN